MAKSREILTGMVSRDLPWGESFSHGVREELARIRLKTRCRPWMLAAILEDAKVFAAYGGKALRFSQASAARLTIKLLKEAEASFTWERVQKTAGSLYVIKLPAELALSQDFSGISLADNPNWSALPRCCRRAWLGGLFLVAGSVSAPERGYHLEWTFQSEVTALALQCCLRLEDMQPYVLKRRGAFVVSLKRAQDVASALSLIGATSARLQFEETRAMKETTNNLHRRVNAETANLSRSVQAAVRQIGKLRYLAAEGILGRLPGELRQLAELRMANAEASLRELGEMAEPPLTRGTVARRLTKLEKMVDSLGVPTYGCEATLDLPDFDCLSEEGEY